jgi:hypothetical protein
LINIDISLKSVDIDYNKKKKADPVDIGLLRRRG